MGEKVTDGSPAVKGFPLGRRWRIQLGAGDENRRRCKVYKAAQRTAFRERLILGSSAVLILT
jgi:hypothetical protein